MADTTPIRYVLHPGSICNKEDGKCRFITAQELAKLYNVPLRKCYILDSKNLDTYSGYKEREYDRHLYPKPDGNYSL